MMVNGGAVEYTSALPAMIRARSCCLCDAFRIPVVAPLNTPRYALAFCCADSRNLASKVCSLVAVPELQPDTQKWRLYLDMLCMLTTEHQTSFACTLGRADEIDGGSIRLLLRNRRRRDHPSIIMTTLTNKRPPILTTVTPVPTPAPTPTTTENPSWHESFTKSNPHPLLLQASSHPLMTTLTNKRAPMLTAQATTTSSPDHIHSRMNHSPNRRFITHSPKPPIIPPHFQRKHSINIPPRQIKHPPSLAPISKNNANLLVPAAADE
jgi:hypothetical protein